MTALGESLAAIRAADMGREEQVRFRGEFAPKQTSRFRPEYVVRDCQSAQNQTFGIAPIPAVQRPSHDFSEADMTTVEYKGLSAIADCR